VLRDLDLRPLFEEGPQLKAANNPMLAAKRFLMKAIPKPSRLAVVQWALATVAAALAVGLPFFATYRHAKAFNPTEPSAAPSDKTVVNQRVPVASARSSAPPISSQLKDDRTADLWANARSAAPPPSVLSQDEIQMVRIESNDTLSKLCIRKMGRYDEQVLRDIRILNPWLSNPDRIRIGQSIRMPAREMILTAKEGDPPSPIQEGK
jgi:hypothetical protein